MVDEPKGRKNKDEDWIDQFNAISTQDCTGLIPAAPVSEDEHEAYREIYDFEASDILKSDRDE